MSSFESEIVKGDGRMIPATSVEENDIDISTVTSEHELLEIKALQLANSKPALTPEEIEKEGFVTAQYTIEFLKRMHSFAPSIIAKDMTKPIGTQVIGYVLVTTKDIRGEHNLLDELFHAIDEVRYFDVHTMTWRYMKDVNYTLSGQLCVAKGYRHRGLVTRMYHHYQHVMSTFHTSLTTASISASSPVEYCLTDVAMSNPRSVKAHLKAGFEIVETLVYDNIDWYIVLMPVQSTTSATTMLLNGRKAYDLSLVGSRATIANSDDDDTNSIDFNLKQIRLLQLNNSKHLLCSDIQKKEGYVTVQHSIPYLKSMHKYSPAVIASIAGTSKIVGYAIATTKETQGENESMDEFFEEAKKTTYEGKTLDSLNYIVCGQICIAKGHRGKGLLKDLYDYFAEQYRDRYDYLTTDVSPRNERSLKAHIKYGFSVIAEYQATDGYWQTILKKIS